MMCEVLSVVDAFAMKTFDMSFGHQRTSCEVVGHLLGGWIVALSVFAKEQPLLCVTDDVVEFVK